MRTKSSYLLFFILFTCTLIGIEIAFFQKSASLALVSVQKEKFVSLVGLPDLSLVSEAHYVRHRSLSDVFSYFGDSPELLEYFPSTFVYHYASAFEKNPSRIEREK